MLWSEINISNKKHKWNKKKQLTNFYWKGLLEV
jgi:hypothetical protein